MSRDERAGLDSAPDVDALATGQVGHVPVLTVQDNMKKAMGQSTLVIADGNQVRTAREPPTSS